MGGWTITVIEKDCSFGGLDPNVDGLSNAEMEGTSPNHFARECSDVDCRSSSVVAHDGSVAISIIVSVESSTGEALNGQISL